MRPAGFSRVRVRGPRGMPRTPRPRSRRATIAQAGDAPNRCSSSIDWRTAAVLSLDQRQTSAQCSSHVRAPSLAADDGLVSVRGVRWRQGVIAAYCGRDRVGRRDRRGWHETGRGWEPLRDRRPMLDLDPNEGAPVPSTVISAPPPLRLIAARPAHAPKGRPSAPPTTAPLSAIRAVATVVGLPPAVFAAAMDASTPTTVRSAPVATAWLPGGHPRADRPPRWRYYWRPTPGPRHGFAAIRIGAWTDARSREG